MKTLSSIILIVFLTFIIHEAGHLAMAVALGYEAVATINHVRPIGPVDSSHAILIAAAGPAVTFAQGVIGFLLVRVNASLMALHIVVVATLHRMFATIVSLSHPNDEVRVSMDLGLDPWIVPAIVCSMLLVLLILSLRTVKPGWSYLFFAWLGLSIGLTAVVFGEPYFPSIRM